MTNIPEFPHPLDIHLSGMREWDRGWEGEGEAEVEYPWDPEEADHRVVASVVDGVVVVAVAVGD